MTDFLRVAPTSEQHDPESILRVLDSLHKLSTPESSSLGAKLNPFHSETPPRFEFLAISDGPDDPVEFYYGADAHLDTLEKRLRSIYPATFDIERVDVDVTVRLIQPIELTPEEFVSRYEDGNLQYEFGTAERYEIAKTDREQTSPIAPESAADGGIATESIPDHHVVVGETALELAPPTVLDAADSAGSIEKPTVTPEGTVLARPATNTVSPLGVRWCGSGTRKQDWMTSLTPFSAAARSEPTSVDRPGSALASLIDHLIEAPAPIAFQVVFQQRADWQADAAVRKENLVDGRDTFAQEILGALLALEDWEGDRDERQLSESVEKRIESIDTKNAKRSFTANIRAVGVPIDDSRDDLDDQMNALLPAFDPLDGPFYEVEGQRLRDNGYRQKTKEKRARATLQRLLDRELTTGRGKTRPELVLCGAELANFVLVPSAEQLTVEGVRGTRAEQQSRNPLPWPNPDLVQQFQAGMSIGYALDDNGAPRPDPIQIPPALLPTHYGRFASTGGGKSKAIINDALSLRSTTGGPVALVDPKGDGMCENYLRCHYERFGGLDDVYHFRAPETVPAFSFFDVRPALEAGRNREDAIQDKVDHFHDMMRMIMGREEYSRAFVANGILGNLIRALFDGEYGNDVFGLDDLYDATLQMQGEQTVPPISAANQAVEESLTRHFEKDSRQFQRSMGAVGNRLEQLRDDPHLRRIFNHVPEQDDDCDYVGNRFDFRAFLETDATILIDLGDLRPEAQRAITLLVLSNLWDAVQVRRRDGRSDYEQVTNLIIEEAAPVASTKLVSEQLLPQGRSFGLSLGLVMQFPGQVRNRNERAYAEILNNVKTKLIGNISIEHDLAESLAHEDLSPTELRNRINTLPSGEWIAQLPSPSFGETGPAPFSLKPLPIAPGHPESDQPLTESQENQFQSEARPQMLAHTRAQYGITGPDSGTAENHEWGSVDGEDPTTSSNEPDPDPTRSSFIGDAISREDDQNESTPSRSIDAFGENQGGQDRDDPSADSSPDRETPLDGTDDGSIPIKDGGVTVPDDVLDERGLTHDDARFLHRVLDVMNREDDEYTLLDSMRPLRDQFENLDTDRLQEQGLVEATSAAGRRYYTVLPAGRDLLDARLHVGPGAGDVGEKTAHKVGVRLLEEWFRDKDGVDRVEHYYQYDGSVFDIAALDADGALIFVGEVELTSNNRNAPIADYDKLSAVDADAVWAFNSHETAVETIQWLADADRLEQPVTGRDARSFSTIQAAIETLDAPGLTTIRSFRNIDQAVNA